MTLRMAQAKTAASPIETFVYFVRAGDFVKIGQSKRWKVRLAHMQIGSPYTIVPLLILIGDEKLEKRLHNRFRADHFRGEWFHMSPTIGAFIKERIKQKECVAKSRYYGANATSPSEPAMSEGYQTQAVPVLSRLIGVGTWYRLGIIGSHGRRFSSRFLSRLLSLLESCR